MHNRLVYAFATLLLSSFYCANAVAREYELSVPSDIKARYTVIEKITKGNLRTITTRREGPSGTSFAKREVDCQRRMSRYIGTGDTLPEMKASKPGETMNSPVEGSISYYVTLEACV